MITKKLQDTAMLRYPHWHTTFGQWMRYCLVGAVNTLIAIMVLNALLYYSPTAQVQTLVVYNSLAYSAGAISSFVLNKYWTFEHGQRATGQEVRRFVMVLLLEILTSNGLVWLIGTALHPWLANTIVWGNATRLLALAGNTLLSYFLMRFWIFTKKPYSTPEDRSPGVERSEGRAMQRWPP